MRRARVALPLTAAFVATAAYGQDPRDPTYGPPPFYSRAKDCLEREEYACAADAYEKAYMVEGRPAFLRPLALAREKIGDRVGALDAYERYADTCPRDPGRRPCEPVDDRIAALRAALAELELELRGGKPETLVVGGRRVGPSSAKVYAEPGTIAIEATWAGDAGPRRVTTHVTAAAGERVQVALAPPVPAPMPLVRPPRAGCTCAARGGDGEGAALAAAAAALAATRARRRKR